MSALRGNLTDFGIAEVFQLIGQQRKTGVLEIEHGGDRVQLLFDGGAVVRAEPATGKEDAALADMLLRCGLVTRERLLELQQETERSLQRLALLAVERGAVDREQLLQMEDLLTQETLFRVLRWSEGSFAFTASPVHHDRQGRLLAAEQILMDGLRMVDEWRTFASEVPSDETVFQHVGRFEDYQAAHASDGARLEHAKRVYLLVDGRLPVRRVIDLSRLGTFEVTRILAELRREGLLEPLDPAQLEKQRPTSQFDLRPPPSRPWIAGALPLVLLLAVAALGQRDARTPLPTDTFPLPHAGLAQAYEAIETQRVRKALEAWRFERGTLPARLDELVEAGFLPPGALTRPDGRPYYYERRGEESLLLAPEH
jgi:hypothetical protein